MDRADIPYISATGLSHLLRKKDVSAVEAVEAYLERIEALDDKLNAFLTVCHDEALEAARGNYLGPRHGIPVAVKDQLYTKGVPTTLGSPLFKDFIPDEMPL